MTAVNGVCAVIVPASSANLGPGFDTFGLALTLHDELIATEIPSGLEIEVAGEGAGSVSRGPENLVVRAMEAAFAHVGARPTGIRLTCTNAIPHARGLGSSSAAIVGGLALGGHLVGQPLDERDLLVLATQLEGHPDNVAAAIHGGFTIAWSEPTGPQVLRLDAQLPVTVLVPPSPVSTDMARRLLPARVPHADASSNAGRAALLVAALQGHPELLMAATEDLLHQPYRAEAMPQSYELVQELRSVDIPAVISGAGPTVLAFARELPVPDGWVAHELDVDQAGVRVR
ncbi:MAG TPA: homoserine kinase [Aeromicrobium sp.]|nr:homoserine kinase [Aeromicrobium sp.]